MWEKQPVMKGSMGGNTQLLNFLITLFSSWLFFRNCFSYLLCSSCIVRALSWCTHLIISLTRIHNRKMHACAGKKKKKNLIKVLFFVHQKFQLDRVHLQEVKRSSYEHTKKCADQLLLLGQVSITRWWYIYGRIDFLFCIEYIKHAFIHTDTVITENVLCLSLIKRNGQ